MSKWFSKKDNLVPSPAPPEQPYIRDNDIAFQTQTLQKLENLVEKLDNISKKVETLETGLNKLIESNKHLLDYYSTREQRDINHMIRSYNLKNEKQQQPINFVPSKTSF